MALPNKMEMALQKERASQSTVQTTPTGQVVVTIPRAIAHAMNIQKGDYIEFKIEAGKIVLHHNKWEGKTKQ